MCFPMVWWGIGGCAPIMGERPCDRLAVVRGVWLLSQRYFWVLKTAPGDIVNRGRAARVNREVVLIIYGLFTL